MNYYLAPMEGITGYIYRNAYHKYFGGMEKYFTPFLSPHMNKAMTSREKNDILPEHNQGLFVVPQLLTNDSEAFCRAMMILNEMGYKEVNLNLGCPSGTVVAKGKGAGFLAQERRENLAYFLDQIYNHSEKYGMEISIKTRIGMESPEEFGEFLPLFFQFPVKELIVHPRVQTDFYRNTPNEEAFLLAVSQFDLQKKSCKQGGKMLTDLCYNGDIFSPKDFAHVSTVFPEVGSVMLGRGAIANPGLVEWISTGRNSLDKKQLRSFHDEILSGYREIMSGDKNALFKMKELWTYLFILFPGCERQAKRIRKANTLDSYLSAVDLLFEEGKFCPESAFQGF